MYKVPKVTKHMMNVLQHYLMLCSDFEFARHPVSAPNWQLVLMGP